ncbi:endonuclease/exonuclease/phosphatase family metal-dependent hydrolase [Roseivirga pacifica]|uniref:Metal-dependent hydrolase, endonuclease/exonuclease/phosphatase family n=1 Tax=Roseivirga pacifica TaxID=1267423 RepID=A0A1I0NK25_9BACT|nr:endonuclease/exonuclease/phosphatase family protein [Roseivirga pacifica]RKQ51259.1 endonuclease/exonuclease/phosphatase family metal-dependent hydrolase [Roseivirga pacifica]SEW01750.1 Metal-dependent hydrolase, endonuclease/exonuclease/phosphatase family [Roseivirga pacifica]
MKKILLSLLIILSFSADYQASAQEEFKVVTLNIRYGTPADHENAWKNRRKRLLAVFKSYSDQIIATQEALPLQIKDILQNNSELEVVYRSRTKAQDDGPANAIFYSKRNWELVTHETFWLSNTPEEPASKSWGNSLPRTASIVVLEHKSSGKQIKLLNVLLDHRSEESREKSVELILRKLMTEVEPMPTLVVGDLNVRPTDAIVSRMEEFFTDTFEGDILLACTYHNYQGGSHCPRYDYIFFQENAGIKKTGYKIDKWESKGLYPQDHYPVVATFRLENSEEN